MKRFMFVMLCFVAGGLSLGCTETEQPPAAVPAEAGGEAAGGDQEAKGQNGQDNGDNGSDNRSDP